VVIPALEYIGKAAVVIDIADRQRYLFADGINLPGQAGPIGLQGIYLSAPPKAAPLFTFGSTFPVAFFFSIV
jgi:hypothetical protein